MAVITMSLKDFLSPKRIIKNAPGTDSRVYGDLIYRCRRCGEEGRIEDVPNCDNIAYFLMNGNPSQVFMTCNFYQDEETGKLYKDCMHHECEPGRYGVMELIGADIKGQIYLADKYKKHNFSSSKYDPSEEIPIEDILNGNVKK